MSVQQPEKSTREKMLQRVARCVVCKCERYEFHGKADGYDTCVCAHTQWGHRK